MASDEQDFETYINTIRTTLTKSYVTVYSFNQFQQDLDNICKLYLSMKPSPEDIETYLTSAINELKNYYRKNSMNMYESDSGKTNRCFNAIKVLHNSYLLMVRNSNNNAAQGKSDQRERHFQSLPPEAVQDFVNTEAKARIDEAHPNMSNSDGFDKGNSLSNFSFPSEAKVSMESNYQDEERTKNLEKAPQFPHTVRPHPMGENECCKKRLEIYLHQKNEEIARINKELQKANEQLDMKNKEIFDFNNRFSAQIIHNQSNKENVTKMEQLAEQSRNANAFLKAIYNNTIAHQDKQDLLSKIDLQNKEISSLRAQLNTEASSKELIQFKLQSAEKNLTTGEATLKVAQEEARKKGEQLLELGDQRRIVEDELKQYKLKCEDLQTAKDRSADIESKLQVKTQELISKLNELSTCKDNLLKLEKHNRNVDDQLKVVEKRHEDFATKLNYEVHTKTKEITSLKSQLKMETEKCEKYNKNVSELKLQLDQDNAKCGSLEARYKELQEQLELTVKSKAKVNDELNKKISDVETRRKDIAGQFSKALEECKTHSDKLGKAQNEIEELKKKLNRVEDESASNYSKYCDENAEKKQLKRILERHLIKENNKQQKLKQFVEDAFKNLSFEDICNSEVEESKKHVLSQLDEIKLEADRHSQDIGKFSGDAESKTFLHIQEMILISVGKIDQIQSQGYEDIKKRKRDLIKYCHELDSELQRKAAIHNNI